MIMMKFSPIWDVETDALPGAAQSLTKYSGWGSGGRLGTATATNHPHALELASALRREGHQVWISWTPRQAVRRLDFAEGALEAYKRSREQIVSAVHAALEAGLTKTRICALSGLSRQGLDNIIGRHGLDEFVEESDD